MPTRVRFRFNKATGEVEEFLVDDQDRSLPEAEHDRIARDVAQMVAVDAAIVDAGTADGAGSEAALSQRIPPSPAADTADADADADAQASDDGETEPSHA